MDATRIATAESSGFWGDTIARGGPERPIFGKIRYMSSDNTKRKLRLKSYLSTYGSDPTTRELFPT